MRILGAAVVLLAACGGGDDGGSVDEHFDAHVDPYPDAEAEACGTTWTLVDVPARGLVVLSDEGFAGRTVRVGVTIDLGGCDDLAMMSVGRTLEGQGVVIYPRVWRRTGPVCTLPAETILRPVVLDDLTAGVWQIDSPGVASVTVTVGAGAPACDPGRTACVLDCDCDESAGERCLTYGGFAGPTSECARPCEANRDCGGTGRCDREVADGLSFACVSASECDAGTACPTGWTCEAGACTPDFTLTSGSRHTCVCDADCDPGLRCAEPFGPPGERRCEALCETAGPWCQGAHQCGAADQDLGGLASVDSVCGFLGE